MRAGAKTFGGQIILEVQNAGELGLVEQRQAENGASLALTDVGILGKSRLGGGVVENHALSGAQDIVEHRNRQHALGHGLIAQSTVTVSQLVVASA